MLVSTRGRYALRIMMELAKYDRNRYIPLPLIAENQEVSEKYLESIIKLLVKAKLLTGVRGKGGGYRVHGGGFAGTIQAFVPHAEVEHYRSVMNAAFGDDACVVMSIRPEGAIKVY